VRRILLCFAACLGCGLGFRAEVGILERKTKKAARKVDWCRREKYDIVG